MGAAVRLRRSDPGQSIPAGTPRGSGWFPRYGSWVHVSCQLFCLTSYPQPAIIHSGKVLIYLYFLNSEHESLSKISGLSPMITTKRVRRCDKAGGRLRRNGCDVATKRVQAGLDATNRVKAAANNSRKTLKHPRSAPLRPRRLRQNGWIETARCDKRGATPWGQESKPCRNLTILWV
jgi:hypothetical protein